MNLILTGLALTGIVGIYKKRTLLVRFLTATVIWNLIWGICWLLIWCANADDFTIPKEAAMIVTCLLILLFFGLGVYFFYTLESLCFTLKREIEEEEDSHSQAGSA